MLTLPTASFQWHLNESRNTLIIPHFATLCTEWTEFVCSSHDFNTVASSHDEFVVASPSISGSEFEFDCRLSELEDLPCDSPKLITSASWIHEQSCVQEVVPFFDCPSPRVSVGQLMAAEIASCGESTPRSTQLKNGQEEIRSNIGGRISGNKEETESSNTLVERRNLRLSSPSLRVHNAQGNSSCTVTNFDGMKEDEKSKGTKWVLKDFLRWSMRKKDQAQRPEIKRSCGKVRQRSMPRQELHYKRAQSEKLGNKKTALPYRQGLLGCFGGPPVFGDMPRLNLASP